MNPASPYTASGYKPNSPRERLVSSAMSLGIILIVLLLAIFQTVVAPQQSERQRPTTFNVAADDPNKAARSSQSRPKAPQAATRAPQEDSPRPKPVITVQKQVERPDTPEGIPGFIPLSSADFAASDIGKMKGPAKGSDNDGKGNDARTAYGPGEGPGGVRLYDAEWYRRPTDAQLSTYMPNKPGLEGWGLVACRTIADYHVEDCTILGESPRGSGFGRAVQNAAWQFLVRPPRIDNKPQVGEWVRIRITYSSRGATAR
jgi:hypothetical protein